MLAAITGATGFVGGRLAHRLSQSGYDVRALVRSHAAQADLSRAGLDTVHGSLQDVQSLRRTFDGAEVIFHCAACSSDWAPADDFYEVNTIGTRNVFEAASQQKSLRKLVHVSTTDVYGFPKDPCDESGDVLDVGLPYSQTKISGECEAWKGALHGEIPLSIVRPATIYGPRSKHFAQEIGEHLLAGTMAYIDGGHAPGGFIYIDDAVDALISVADSPRTAGCAYNLTDGSSATWRDYLCCFAEELGVSGPRINVPKRLALLISYCLEAIYSAANIQKRPLLTRYATMMFSSNQAFVSSRIQNDTDFRPNVSLEEGVRETARWFLEQSD